MLSVHGQRQQQGDAHELAPQSLQLAQVDSQDEKCTSLRKFQEEKRSLCRNVDEEVIFETDETMGSAVGGKAAKSSANAAGIAAVGDTSCSSTTPTATSWTVADEERKQDQDEEDQDEEDDRKPAAIDISGKTSARHNSGASSARGIATSPLSVDASVSRGATPIASMKTPSPPRKQQLPSPTKSTPSTSSSTSTWPPPLISPDQEQLLAISQNQRPRKSLQKKLQQISPSSSSVVTETATSPTTKIPSSEPQYPKVASLPAVSPNAHPKPSAFLKDPPPGSCSNSNSETQVAPPEACDAPPSPARPRKLEGQLSPPGFNNQAGQQDDETNMGNLKQPPPTATTTVEQPLQELPSTPSHAQSLQPGVEGHSDGSAIHAKTLQSQHHHGVHATPHLSSIGGEAGIIGSNGHAGRHPQKHPHNPGLLQRQRGNLHVNGLQQQQQQLPPGSIIVHHPNRNPAAMNNRHQYIGMNKNHNRPKPRLPFSVSEETLQAAAMANQIQRQQRNQQRQKIKMQRLHQQQQEMQRRQEEQMLLEEQLLKKSNGGDGVKGLAEDDLGISISGSDSLEDDSIVKSSSFAIASKVLERETFPELTRTGHSKGGMSRVRRSSVMAADLASIVSDNKMPVSEPRPSLGAGGRSLRRPTSALATRRQMFTREKSSRVIQNTATLSSFRSGVSSVTMDSAMKAAALRKAQQRAAAIPLRFDIKQVTLDNPSSSHSSIGYNSASMRSILDNSAHFNGSILPGTPIGREFKDSKHSGAYHSYNPQLAPHIESDSVSALNQSNASIDASSAISPPSRDEMRKRRESIRINPPAPRRPSHRPSLKGGGDDMSQISRLSGAVSQASVRRRPSNASKRGLRRAPIGNADAYNGINAGESPIPVPTLVDPTKFLRQAKKENEKNEWDQVLVDQNDLIMKLACELSQRENEDLVKKQQQLHPPKSSQPKGVTQTTSGQSSIQSVLNGSQFSIQQQMLIQQQATSGSSPYAVQPSYATPSGEPMDDALKLALEESKRVNHRSQLSKTDSERALEVALEVSRVEAAEFDRQRHAIPLSLDLSSPPSKDNEKKERLAPLAPMESSGAASTAGSEAAGTMDIAIKLSKQEHEHEVSMRRPKGQLTAALTAPVHDHEVRLPKNSGHNGKRPKKGNNSHHGSALDYSMSTTRSLVMPSEMLEDDSVIRSEPPRQSPSTTGGDDALSLALAMSLLDATPAPRSPTPMNAGAGSRTTRSQQRISTDRGESDEHLALALAMSKMDATTTHSGGTLDTPVDPLQHLSQDESMAYALELSRHTPGAFDSRLETPRGNSSTPAASPPRVVASRPMFTTPSPQPPSRQQQYAHVPPPQFYPPMTPQYMHYPIPPQPFSPAPSFYSQPFSPSPSYASYHMPPPQQYPFSPPPPYPSYPPQPPQQHYHYPDHQSYGTPPTPFPPPPVPPPRPPDTQDEALKMALAASMADAYSATSAKASATPTTTVTDDDSLALALALSRRDAYGNGC